jgi:hypothetical protein
MYTRSLAAVGLTLLAGLTLFVLAQNAPPAGRTPLDSHRCLGTPKTFRNLTLIPVYDPAAKSTDAYMTLDEGLKAKVVKVKEAQGGGEVNRLYISNLGRKPLYIMAGEVVLGGQQDRCLGTDIVLLPGKRQVPVPVFCVEHGRWTGQADFQDSALMVASADVRASAQTGGFAASRPAAPAQNAAANATARRARSGAGVNVPSVSADPALSETTVSESQQQVWDKVARKTRKFSAESDTGTYRGVLNMANGSTQQSITPYVQALSGSLGSDPHLVGAMAAVNGKVIAADIFGDPALFRKLWPKLLRSYAADAAENAPGKKHKTPAVTAEMGRTFFIAANRSKSSATNKTAVSTTLRLDSKAATSYRFQASDGPAPPKAAGAAGEALHENVLSK